MKIISNITTEKNINIFLRLNKTNNKLQPQLQNKLLREQ